MKRLDEASKVLSWILFLAVLGSFLYFLIPINLDLLLPRPNTAVITAILQVETTLLGLLGVGSAIYEATRKSIRKPNPLAFHLGIAFSISFVAALLTAILSALAALNLPTQSPFLQLDFQRSVIFTEVGIILFLARLLLGAWYR